MRYSALPLSTYGFAIDLKKCIGCHACTIACKAEHDIPVGANRCWVKTVEHGTFPNTQRLFFPVLCNQCTDAPCVTICPTNALYKRRDAIVDLNGDACIGCRACMAACPYDQLFIDPNTRTAEKCNFCANRVENKLEPACVSVCPTQCRIFGDLDDPTSEVAQIVARETTEVRRPDKGTGPRVFYLGAHDSVIRPEVATRPFMFKEGQVHLRPLGAPAPDPARPGDARVDYDVPHRKAWGFDLVLYLLTKGISTGTMLLSALLWLGGDRSALTGLAGPATSLIFAALTSVVLVIDLERPERFWFILSRPNWRSWMARGAFFLTAHGGLATLWITAWLFHFTGVLVWIAPIVIVVSFAATIYTGLLFAQARGRDLWQGPGATIDLVAQAGAEGSAAMLLVSPFVSSAGATIHWLGWVLAAASAAHLLILVFENLLSRSPTLHHALAVRSIRRGAYRHVFWIGALGLGGVLPLLLISLAVSGSFSAAALAPAAVVALAGGLAWEYVWVEAGQAVPIS